MTALAIDARADVTFDVTFEPGSKWLTESYSAQARANLEGLLNDLGARFNETASIEIFATDDNTTAFASAGSNSSNLTSLAGKIGQYWASGLWHEIVKGTDLNGAAVDATINWNFDIAGLYGGDTNRFLANIRGLARHEIMHPLGMSSFLLQIDDGVTDPRGTQKGATVHDAFLIDVNGDSLLGAFDGPSKQFTINDYALDSRWKTTLSRSGIRFSGRNASGGIERYQVSGLPANGGSPARIDFSHVPVVSYANARPSPGTWGVIVEEDVNYLRGLGYDMKGGGGGGGGGGDDGTQPDAWIGLVKTRQKGNGVYNTTGAGQTVKLRAYRSSRRMPARNFFFTLQNDGIATDSLTGITPKSNRSLKFKYFRINGGKKNVTAAMRQGGGLDLVDLAPGERIDYLGVVKPTRRLRRSKRKFGNVIGASSGSGNGKDRTRLKIQVRP